MNLNADKVVEIMKDCLFREDEVTEGKIPDNAVLVEGIVRKFGFHRERLESHREEVLAMLADLPDGFMRDKGGGWSFLNMCVANDDTHWTGMHQTMEALCVLGIGLGLVRWCLPREYWNSLPGGMPYLQVSL